MFLREPLVFAEMLATKLIDELQAIMNPGVINFSASGNREAK